MLCLTACISLMAQNISGKLVDEAQQPLPYVNPEKRNVPLYKNDAFQKVQKRRVPEKR